MNQQGLNNADGISPRALSVEEAVELFQDGAGLLDTRSKGNFLARNVPGGVHIELSELPGRIATALPADVPLVLLLDSPSDFERVAKLLTDVGFARPAGYLASLDDWEAKGYPVTSGEVFDIDPAELKQRIENDPQLLVLDVREPWEFRGGRVPKAKLVPLGQLQARLNELDPNVPVAVICQVGSRSQTGAALLAQKGFKQVFNVTGGTAGWRQRGFPVES